MHGLQFLRHLSLLVVVHNLDFVGVSFAPHKAKAPLVIDADATPPLTVALQFLQLVSRERRKRSQIRRSVQQVQLPKRLPLYRLEPAHRITVEKALSIGAAEGPEHGSMVYCFSLNVKEYEPPAVQIRPSSRSVPARRSMALRGALGKSHLTRILGVVRLAQLRVKTVNPADSASAANRRSPETKVLPDGHWLHQTKEAASWTASAARWRAWSDKLLFELKEIGPAKTEVKAYAIPNLLRYKVRKNEKPLDPGELTRLVGRLLR
jgi:hypothetical protein